MAARDAISLSRCFTLGAPASAGGASSYPLRRGGRLSVFVFTTPVAKATRSVLSHGLGIGAVLVLPSLLVAGIDRVVAPPLGRFTEAVRRVAGGDAAARADEDADSASCARPRSASTRWLAKVTAQRLGAARRRRGQRPAHRGDENRQFHPSLGIELKPAERH